MHHEAERWTRRLRRELGDPRLVVRWNEEIERFQVGERVRSGASDLVRWFYTVTDGNSGWRGMGWHVIRKVSSMDKSKLPDWAHDPERFAQMVRDEREAQERKEAAERQYELTDRVRYMRRYWDPFNVDPEKAGVRM